jgi:endonuclease YncB( thermonuclease family)
MSNERLYWYRLKITRIVDADTFEVIIDKGHREYCERRIRLYGVDAYEKNTPKGKAAIQFVTDLIKLDTWYFAKSYMDKSDSFGRYLYEVFLDDECAVSLGNFLIVNGLAVQMVR